ncbi:MAG: YbaK/EbsC family protein [Anaerolineaceae bacterium]|jgi:prolyl-tRNA editing enzyme YbaK/EbsC (Cys-tRNA(Pro) deacylase)|nr:MAG: YbaK/EbsC family protein [Anaerolineaceae bacterium]
MALSEKSQLVQQALEQHHLFLEVVEMDASTRTAQDAASAVGCEIGQICKSLVFRSGDTPILFLVSGKNQLNVTKVSAELNIPLEKADANFTREKTGFAIGGIPPVAHTTPIATYIDRTLLTYKQVWAAAGTPHAVFKLESHLLLTLTGGKVIDVT